MNTEPLVTVASITAIASATVTALVAFDVDLSEGQTKAVLGLVAVLAPIAVAVFARGRVSPAGRLRPPLPPSE